MRSFRALALCSVGCVVLAASSVMSFAQPGDPPPPPPAAPKDQPGSDKPKGDPQDQPKPDAPRGQPGPGGEGRRGPGGGQRGGDGAPPSTKQGMSTMNRALKTLRGQVGDASKKDENLKLVGDLERGCLGAKGALPDRVLGRIQDVAKRAEAAVTYRKQLIVLMEKLLKLETAIMDGKADVATTLVGEIGKLRDESHEMLGVED